MSSTCLTIDLDQLAKNWQTFQQAYEQKGLAKTIGAVVKADAYGLGAERVVRRLWDEGCRIFFVAHACEGAVVAQVIDPGLADIYVFHGCRPGQEELFATHRLIPVLNSFDDVERWASFAQQSKYRRAGLHVDTGMNRLGFSKTSFQEVCSASELLDCLDVCLIMTHLVHADEPGEAINVQQKQIFEDVMALRPPSLAKVPLSMANSAGVLNGADYHYDVARVGIGLYGGNPFSGQPNPCQPVVTLESEVLQINELAKAQSVSYGACWQAERPSRIATLAIGYADGLLRHSGQFGHVALQGQLAPIVGRVTMDLTMVDITDIDGGDVKVGDRAEIVGKTITVDDLATAAGTIGYEVLTNFGRQSNNSRVKRTYIG